jgi:hypothetical protein
MDRPARSRDPLRARLENIASRGTRSAAWARRSALASPPRSPRAGTVVTPPVDLVVARPDALGAVRVAGPPKRSVVIGSAAPPVRSRPPLVRQAARHTPPRHRLVPPRALPNLLPLVAGCDVLLPLRGGLRPPRDPDRGHARRARAAALSRARPVAEGRGLVRELSPPRPHTVGLALGPLQRTLATRPPRRLPRRPPRRARCHPTPRPRRLRARRLRRAPRGSPRRRRALRAPRRRAALA